MTDALKLPPVATADVGGGGGGGGADEVTTAERQVAKLRRFLGTLVQFGSDIRPEVGDRVRDLVVRLLDSSATIEEFHSELHSATNYPLRPFVIPFLRASLPLMQCELVQRSRLAGKSTAQFLADTELAEVLELGAPAAAAAAAAARADLKRRSSLQDSDEPGQPDRSTKRRVSVLVANDNNSADDDVASPPRGVAMATAAQSPSSSVSSARQPVSGEHRTCDLRIQRRRRRQQRRAAATPPAPRSPGHDDGAPDGGGNEAGGIKIPPVKDGEWRRLESMLSAVADMVSRARRSLAGLHRTGAGWSAADTHLQEQAPTEAAGSSSPAQLRDANAAARQRQNSPETEGNAGKARLQLQLQLQQQHLDNLVSTIRRQAQQELRLALAAAEARASELVAAEKLRTERLLALAREEALVAARLQTNSPESCWNCGRAASETCSGCSTARYCGSFCQHKDWDRHQKACRRQLPMMQDSLADSSRKLQSTGKSERRNRENTG